jgi:hypothetical protein
LCVVQKKEEKKGRKKKSDERTKKIKRKKTKKGRDNLHTFENASKHTVETRARRRIKHSPRRAHHDKRR